MAVITSVQTEGSHEVAATLVEERKKSKQRQVEDLCG